MKNPLTALIPAKFALVLVLAAAVCIPAGAQSAPTWLRTPAISPDGRTTASRRPAARPWP
jgi:hypothetical protein